MLLPKTHIRLGVVDTNRSAAFYEALLGATPTHPSAGVAVFELDSPPLVLRLEECPRPRRARRRRTRPGESTADPVVEGERFALLLTEPRDMAHAAVALRRAGVKLRLEDQGIEILDPDGNAWRVRFEPLAPGRTVRTP